MGKNIEWRQNVPESVYCILVFSELNVLPPEVVMHIVSFLKDRYCVVCKTNAAVTCGYICALTALAREFQESWNGARIKALMAAQVEGLIQQHEQ